MRSSATTSLDVATLLAPVLTAKRYRTQVISQRAERRDRQEQECTNDYDRAKEQTTEGCCVVTQSSQAEWSALLHPEKRRHRDGCYDRKVASEHDYEAACYVPRYRFCCWIRVAVETVAGTETVESGAVIRRRRRELIDNLRQS